MNTNKKVKLGATQYIALGFLVVILMGTVLLKLPISHVGKLNIFDALFVSTSATCVTGLSTVSLVDNFTLFGQFVILCLIQIGGLGFMLIIALVLMTLGKKISLKNRILIGQSVNSNNLEGLVRLTRKVLKYTFTFEIIGALIIATEFVPLYGWRSRIN